MERAAPSPCWESPRLGPTAGSASKEETVTLVDPMTLEESLQIRNNRLSIPVTVSGIHSHSKTSKYMIMYNSPSSRGTMTRTLTLQVTRDQQHNTSRPSVHPNYQDYVSVIFEHNSGVQKSWPFVKYPIHETMLNTVDLHAGLKRVGVPQKCRSFGALFGCAGTDCIGLSIILSACPIIAPRDVTEHDFIVMNVVISLCLCLRVETSTDPMHQSRALDRYMIL